jgi:hypothetical protein
VTPARLRVGAILVVHLAFVVMAGVVWEPAHDEGVTWHQAFGGVSIDPPPAPPVAIASLYRSLDGAARRSLSDIVDALMGDGGMHPPLYYAALSGWASWVGTGRSALMIPMYICSLLALLLLRDLARRLVPGPDSGDWAMVLLALSPWFVEYVNLARPYAWIVCLTIASTSLLVRMISPGAETGRVATRVGFAVLSLAGLLSLYHYAFVVAWQLLLLGVVALRSPRRGRASLEVVALGAAILLGFAAVWLPNLLAHLQTTGEVESYFSGFPALGQWPVLFARWLLLFGLGGAVQSVVAWLVVPVFAVLGFATLLLLPRSFLRSRPLGEERLVWLSLPLLPLGIGIADWLHGTHTLFITKTSAPLLPFAILLVVRAFTGLAEPWRRLALGCWTGLFLVAIAGDLHTTGSGRNPMETVASEIARNDDPSHVVVLSSTFPGYAPPLLLELRAAGVERVRVLWAPWFRLDDLVESVTVDPSVTRLTLVNLAVSYSPPETWQPEHIVRLTQRAGAAGWTTSRAGADAERVLKVLPPVPVKYFAF